MAYDQSMAMQVRARLQSLESVSEREMFGGIGFMLSGNMACGISGDDLIVRVGPDAYDAALQQEGVQQFDMTGRPMRGWVVVRGSALASEAEIDRWVQKGVSFAQSLPAK